MTPSRDLIWDRRRFLAAGMVGLAAGMTPGADVLGEDAPTGRWDDAAIDEVATLDQPGWAQGVAFSPDGKTLVAAGFAEGGVAPSWITIWDVPTWRRRREIAVPKVRIHTLAFAPDGEAVVVACLDESQLILCDVGNGNCRTLFHHEGTGGLQATPTFSPDGRYMMWASSGEGVTIWETSDWSKAQVLLGTRDGGLQIVADPSKPWEGIGGRAYALGCCGTLFQISPVALRPHDIIVPPGARYVGPALWKMQRVRGVERPWSAGHLRLSRDGKMAVFLASDDLKPGWIAIHDIGNEGQWTLRSKIPLDIETHMIYSLAITPDARAIVVGGGLVDMNIRRWDLASGRSLAPLTGHRNSVHDLATSADGWLASAGNGDKTVKVWAPRGATR